jgi:hypothetical protein
MEHSSFLCREIPKHLYRRLKPRVAAVTLKTMLESIVQIVWVNAPRSTDASFFGPKWVSMTTQGLEMHRFVDLLSLISLYVH